MDHVQQKRMRRTAGFFALLTLFVFSSSFAQDETIKRSFDVGYGGKLTIESDLGSIKVSTSSSEKVDIEIQVDARDRDDIERLKEDFDISFDQNGDDVMVRMENKRRSRWGNWWGNGPRLRVTFYVTVPNKYNLDLRTAGGSISVEDLEGEVWAKTSGGSLDFGNIKGHVEGKTSGGSVSVGEVDGDVNVHTSGGSINIDRARGSVDARTSGGSIRVDEVFGTIRASTSGGSITARISKQPEADCRLTTSGGNVTVYMERNIGVNVDASTSGGRVSTDFPVTIRGEISKRSLRAKVNDGGPELYLRTSGGSISLKEM
ncbi:MAG: DUF4097 family beta strand repeat protein [Deferribacteres bacterium]|nr:DUF4097 family beta strand repeat protein [candidate division KSB1 bacterium]MCB9509825.1 DUF4097 family beta strand repeat protein [Deferribacteres bacterium]